MKIILIRHGATKGNLEKRYIGCRTDEPLCPEGIAALQSRRYPVCEALVGSPMRRCMQTAEILYPGLEMRVFDAFRECDFGDFEEKNAQELSGDSAYQRWIDSGGAIAFPGGEHPMEFRRRCESAFCAVTDLYAQAKSIALIVHGGTIMALLARYAGGNFYDYQIPNGGGYLAEFEKGHITRLEKL